MTSLCVVPGTSLPMMTLSLLFWKTDTIIKTIIVWSTDDDLGHLVDSSSSFLCISELTGAEADGVSKAGLLLSQIFES